MGQLFGDVPEEQLSPEKVTAVVAWLCHERCTLTGEVLGAIGDLVTRVFIAETRGLFAR